MVIQNGIIEFKTQTAGEIDPETGYRTAATDVAWGDPIPCQFNPVTLDLQARTALGSEHFKEASYEVFIEAEPTAAAVPPSEQVRITDLGGTVIGEFSIIKIEPFEAVCEVKITV